MNFKRRLITWSLILAVFCVGVFIFYKYFPEIWGDIVYPLEYKDEIIKSSEEYHVDRNLIAAVIYTESHFNPNAGSGAGAKGLMQLMPSTARGVARNIGMSDYADSKIFDPAINIRLGTAYLRSAIDSRDGNIDVALSNYNGGPRVAGRFEIAMDRSVLPRETDGYIRKVRSVWDIYEQIYGSNWEGPSKPFKAPSSGGGFQAALPQFSLPTIETFTSKVDIKNLLGVLIGK